MSFPAGVSLLKLSLSYEQAGDLLRAIDGAREALRILQAVLPSSHLHVTAAQQWVLHLEATFQKRS